jgi:hypothetical protein
LILYQQARRTYYAFEDEINRGLRAQLRTIAQAQLDFEITRGSVFVAITRVEFAQRGLEAPPGLRVGRSGIASTQNLLDSLNALLASQNRITSEWVGYEILRMTLDLDLGTMELDDRGIWIDPGTVRQTPTGGELPGDFPPIPPFEELLPPGRPQISPMATVSEPSHPRLVLTRSSDLK